MGNPTSDIQPIEPPALGWIKQFGEFMFLRSGGRNEYSAESYRQREYGYRPYRSRSDDGSWFYAFVAALGVIAVLLVGVILPQFVPESVAYSTAEGLGYTDVEVVSRDWVLVTLTGCSQGDLVKFTVSGTNPAGDQQTFYVCAGLFKAGTPRFP